MPRGKAAVPPTPGASTRRADLGRTAYVASRRPSSRAALATVNDECARLHLIRVIRVIRGFNPRTSTPSPSSAVNHQHPVTLSPCHPLPIPYASAPHVPPHADPARRHPLLGRGRLPARR